MNYQLCFVANTALSFDLYTHLHSITLPCDNILQKQMRGLLLHFDQLQSPRGFQHVLCILLAFAPATTLSRTIHTRLIYTFKASKLRNSGWSPALVISCHVDLPSRPLFLLSGIWKGVSPSSMPIPALHLPILPCFLADSSASTSRRDSFTDPWVAFALVNLPCFSSFICLSLIRTLFLPLLRLHIPSSPKATQRGNLESLRGPDSFSSGELKRYVVWFSAVSTIVWGVY